MRLLLLLAVVISARSQAVGWSMHNAPDNDVIITADRGSTVRPRTKVLILSRLLFPTRGDIYQTLPELAQLYSDDSEDAKVDWRSRVDPTTDTEPWSRTDIGSDAELEAEPLCKVGATIWSPCDRSSDTSHDYDSSSSLSLGQSPPEDNDEMKPVIRTSQLKRKQQSTRNRYVGRAKREAVPMETDTQEEAEKRSSAFSNRGGKQRGGEFSSWGGKRNPPFSVLGSVRRRAFTSTDSRRSPAFSSWGGKRSQSFSILGERRMNSWGGKSNPSLTLSTSDDSPAFSILGSKRPASFSSWGGKRDVGFSSWGGKRDPAFTILGGQHEQAYREPAFRIIGGGITEPAFTIVNDKREPAFKILGNHDFPAFSILGNSYEPSFRVLSSKRSFSSWGGKRDSAFNSWGGKRDSTFNSLGGKRDAAFSSWGGKRGSGFSSWGGKRDPAFNSWGGKRDDDADFSKRDSKFSSWGEKRDEDGEDKRSFSSWGGKRDTPESPKRGFSSWGGKRRVATQTEDFGNHHENGTGSKEVVENGLSDADKDKEETEILEKDQTEGEDQDVDKEEDEEGRKHVSTQTSSDFQKFLEEFGNKMQLEDNQEKEDENKKVNEGNDGQEEESEHKSEDEGKPDINMDQEPLAMEDKNVGTTNTEEKGIGTSDLLTISKRIDRSEGRVSRALFSPWGGKRVSPSPSLFSILGSMHKGLGRSDGILSDFLYKRGSSRHSAVGSKKWGQSSVGAVFSSWGGKRSDKGSNLRKISHQNLGRQYRRGADFYSWGGKR